jgi:hypothetical protein
MWITGWLGARRAMLDEAAAACTSFATNPGLWGHFYIRSRTNAAGYHD